MLQIDKYLHDIIIEVTDSTRSSICGAIGPAMEKKETKRITCERNAVGNRVTLRQMASIQLLPLAEVEAYGTRGKIY